MAEWEHDLLDRPIAIKYPESSTRVMYDYTGAYLTTVCEDPSLFDCSGTGPKYIESVTYDALGRRTLVDGPPGDLALSYSTATHRLTGQELTRSNGDRPLDLAYQYDFVGNVTLVIDDQTPPMAGLSSTASFGYDNRNRLAVRTLNAEMLEFKFDKLGNLTGRDLESGEPANQVYAHPQKPHAITTAASGASYVYDADGNVIQRGSSHLGFDSQNRLVCEGPSPGCASADVTFAYDLDGRRLWQKTGTQTVVLLEDLADWDKTQTDAALHITAFGRRIATKSMTSPARRVAGPSVGGVELPLDPGWLVLAFASGGVLWLAVLAVRDGVPGRIRRRPVPAAIALLATASLALPPRAWAGGNPGPGNTFIRFLFHDHLGTNVLVTNPNGNPVRRRVFEPFGKLVAEDGSEAPQRLFTGQRFEPESGLYDFRARWYDPEAGRFLSVDPVVQSPSDPQTVNGYGYVRNNPVNATDSTGKFIDGFAMAFAARWGGAAFHAPYGAALADRIFNHGETVTAKNFASVSMATGAIANSLFNGPGGSGGPTTWAPGDFGGVAVSSGGFDASGGGFFDFAADILGKLWSAPTTALGLVYGAVGMLFGADPSIGNNAIQFENHPIQRFFGAAITLGNVIAYPGSRDAGAFTLVPGVLVPLSLHEFQHTLQAQILGPLYLPLHIIGGFAGIVGSPLTGAGPGGSLWHASWNLLEQGPLSVPASPW